MKRTTLAVLIMLWTVVAVASYMTRSARAEIRVFTAALLASNEVAPVAVNPTETGGVGNATVTLDTVANTARFDWQMTGLSNSSIVILSHIHEGASTVNGPIRVDSGLSPATPVPAIAGAFALSRSNLTVSPATMTAILANPAGFYFNVHTALSPQGVGRGQLVPQQTTALTAPTLSEWGAILMFLLIAAVATYFIAGRGTTLAAAGGEQSLAMAAPQKMIDPRLLARVTLYVEVAVGLGLLAFASRVTPVDVGGALLSGLIVAFVIHLMVMTKRR
jgi:hypothetical protein